MDLLQMYKEEKPGHEMVNLRVSKVIISTGAILGFLIGSGFASGQEALQYFSVYGLKNSLIGASICFLMVAFAMITVLKDSSRLKLERCNDIFDYYCGKTLGAIYKLLVPTLMYMVFVVMLSGAGALVNENYGIPTMVGVLIMAVLVLTTVLLGLDNLVNIIGRIAPIIIVLVVLVSLIYILKNPDGIQDAEKYRNDLGLKKATGHWLSSAINYASFALLGIYPFLAGIGARLKQSEAKWCGLCGSTCFIGSLILFSCALLSCLEDIHLLYVPSVYLADGIYSGLGIVFSVIMICGIYTTAAPLLWESLKRINSNEKSKTYRISAVVLVIIGCFGGQLPFATLVNILFPLQGYMGLLMYIFIAVKHIRISKIRGEYGSRRHFGRHSKGRGKHD